VEVLKSPSIENIEVNVIEETAPGWAKPIVEYIQGKLYNSRRYPIPT
jgi:hypothetical protein